MKISTKLSDYDYDLPKRFIAQYPVSLGNKARDHSRLLVFHRNTERIEHRKFYEIQDYFNPGDLLVLNDTKVISARLLGKRETGGKVEALIVRATEIAGDVSSGHKPNHGEQSEFGVWEVLLKCRGHLQCGEKITFGNEKLIVGILLRRTEAGRWLIKFERRDNTFSQSSQGQTSKDFLSILESIGYAPLPPYIQRNRGIATNEDKKWYQTVFAKTHGAIAAPTAGLHFTKNLLNDLKRHGVIIKFVTLHVGLGTFQPIHTQEITTHKMHSEEFALPTETAVAVLKTKRNKTKVFATGTTTCRVLEAAAAKGIFKPETLNQCLGEKKIYAMKGETDLFIYPPYDFKIVDALITNFHLPKSTLLLLVSAFANREQILKVYEEAKEKGYRFYSYGDAMLIL